MEEGRNGHGGTGPKGTGHNGRRDGIAGIVHAIGDPEAERKTNR